MNSKWHRFMILYILYEKLTGGYRSPMALENLFEENRIRFANRNLIDAEVFYLLDSGLVKGLTSTDIRISSKGVDVVENVLKSYLLHLETRSDKESTQMFSHIMATPEELRREELYHYIMQKKELFKEFLFASEIMDRTAISAGRLYKPIITPNRSSEINQFSIIMGKLGSIKIHRQRR